MCHKTADRWKIGLSFALLLSLPSGWAAPTWAAERRVLVVYAAASLADAGERVGRLFEERTGRRVQLVLASSGSLARKIALGAPADLFLSASRKWIDHLDRAGRLASGTRRAIAVNSLVCVVPAGAEGRLPGPPALLRAGRLALGDPGHAPAGRYARESLLHLRLWESLRSGNRLVFARDVRAALGLAESGAVPAAIVYRTDAARSRRVRIEFAFPADSHSPIVYHAGAVADRPNETAARAFLEFLGGDPARRELSLLGFGPPPPSPAMGKER